MVNSICHDFVGFAEVANAHESALTYILHDVG